MDNYHLSRNGKKIGTYPEDKMREYYAQGRVGPGDLVWKPGMAEWRTAAEVFGFAQDTPPPLPEASVPASPFATSPFAAQEPVASPGDAIPAPLAPAAPLPPKLHWAIVALLSIVTFGFFGIVWAFVQAVWVRRLDRSSKGLRFLVSYLVLVVIGEFLADTAPSKESVQALFAALVSLAGIVAFFLAYFSMRRTLITYYNEVEPIELKLSGAMTFFFAVLYFQYHFTRIAKWKAGEGMTPQ